MPRPRIATLSQPAGVLRPGFARLTALGLVLALVFPQIAWAFDLPDPALGIPEHLGHVTESHQAGGRRVVLIQDLHCHYEIQTNISRILDHLAQNHGLRLVAVEGAAGAVDVSQLAAFPVARIKQAAADHLLREGKLTGMEFYAALGTRPIRLQGAEDQALYAAEQKLLDRFLNSQSQGLISDLREVLHSVKERVFSPALLQGDRRRRAFREGRLGLVDYAVYLGHALQAQDGLDAFPTLAAYVSKHRKVWPGRVDSDALHAELEAAGVDLANRLAQTSPERRLVELEQRLDTLERLLNISATSQDLKNIRHQPDAYNAWILAQTLRDLLPPEEVAASAEETLLDDALQNALAFYQVADERSQALADNTLGLMQKQGDPLAVLVSGGYHTDAILARLREQGVSYLCVRPHMSRQDWTNPYFAILTHQLTPLEKWLAQTQNILAPPLNFYVQSPLFAKVLNTLFAQLAVLDGLLEGAETTRQLEEHVRRILERSPHTDPDSPFDWESARADLENDLYLIPIQAGGTLVIRPEGGPVPAGIVDRLTLDGYEAMLLQVSGDLSLLQRQLGERRVEGWETLLRLSRSPWGLAAANRRALVAGIPGLAAIGRLARRLAFWRPRPAAAPLTTRPEPGAPALFDDLEKALAGLEPAADGESTYPRLARSVRSFLHAQAVSVYTVNMEGDTIQYQHQARIGMRHSTRAEQVQIMAAGNEKYYLFGPDLKVDEAGVFSKNSDVLHIKQRHRAPFVNKNELLRDVLAYSRLPRVVKDPLQRWAVSPWFPASMAALIVAVLARVAPESVGRVNEALWIVLRDHQGFPQGILFINNWDTGQPLLAGADSEHRLALLPVVLNQALSTRQYQADTRKLREDLADIRSVVSQMNSSFGGRLVSQDMRDTIHDLRGGFVLLAFVPRMIKKLSPMEQQVAQLQKLFQALNERQAQINELLEGVRVADEAFRVSSSQQAGELESAMKTLDPAEVPGALAGSAADALIKASRDLAGVRTLADGQAIAQAALGEAGGDAGLRKTLRAIAASRFRQLLEANRIREQSAALADAVKKLENFSRLFDLIREMKTSLYAIRKVLETVDARELAAAGGEPGNLTIAMRDMSILEENIHKFNLFEIALEGVLKNQSEAQQVIEVIPVLERAIAAARNVSPLAFHYMSPPATARETMLVRINPAKLEYLLLNEILANAIKYQAKNVLISAAIVGQELILEVQDDGAGMDAGRLQEVREALRNEQTLTPDRRVAPGVSKGIGFSQMNRVAAEAGGRLEVESGGVGQGTRIRIRLPVTALGADEQLARSAFEEIHGALHAERPEPKIRGLIASGRMYQAIPEMKPLADLNGGIAWSGKNMLDFTQGVLRTLGDLKLLASSGKAPAERSLAWAELQKTPGLHPPLRPDQVQRLVALYRQVARHPHWESLLWIVAMTIMTGKTDAILPQDRFRLAGITARNIVRHYNKDTKAQIPLELAEKIARHYALIGEYLLAETTPEAVARILEGFSPDELALLSLLSAVVIKNVGEGKLTQRNLSEILNGFQTWEALKRAEAESTGFAATRLNAWTLGTELAQPRPAAEAQAREDRVQQGLEALRQRDPAGHAGLMVFLNRVQFYRAYFLLNALSPESLIKLLYIAWKLQPDTVQPWAIFNTDRLPAGLDEILARTAWPELETLVREARERLLAQARDVSPQARNQERIAPVAALLGFQVSWLEECLVFRLGSTAASSVSGQGGVTIYGSLIPGLAMVALLSGNPWLTLAVLVSVPLYGGFQWGSRHLRRLEKSTAWLAFHQLVRAPVAAAPASVFRLQPGQTLRDANPPSRWVRGWLRAVLFDAELDLAGQYQAGPRLEGTVPLLKSAFYILRSMVAGWMLLGERKFLEVAADPGFQKLLQIQSAEETAFEIFAKYGQGGWGELAPASRLSGGWRMRLASALGWSVTGREGQTVYYLPDRLLEGPSTPLQSLLTRVVLEQLVRKVAASRRQDLERARVRDDLRSWAARLSPRPSLASLLKADESALARALKKRNPHHARLAPEVLEAALWAGLRQVRSEFPSWTKEERAANLATLSKLSRRLPRSRRERIGAWSRGGGPVYLPRRPAAAADRLLYWSMMGWVRQAPGVMFQPAGRLHRRLRAFGASA